MNSLMVQVEVQVGAWLMHLFMVLDDYMLFVVQVDYRLIGTSLHQYISQ